MSNFEDYKQEELNEHLNEIVRVDLRDFVKDSKERKIVKKYREAKGVYKIIDQTDGRIYVGSTGDTFRLIHRLKIHWRELNKRTHYNTHLQRCFDKHGEDKFRFEVIEFYQWDNTKTISENKTAIEQREQYYIDTLGGRDKDKGFNQADHAHGRFNWITWETLEERTKITIPQMKQILDKLINTKEICRNIDREVGVPMGTSLKIYKRQTFSKLTEGYVFTQRDTSQRGELSATGKLTEAQALEIIEGLKIGIPIPKLAEKYGIDRASIHEIKNGYNWKHLTKRIKFFDYPTVAKDSELPPVYQYSLDGSYQKEWPNYREIARHYGVQTSTVDKAIKANALYSLNHFWSYEKIEKFMPKVPIKLFFYFVKNGKEDAFFEINKGKPCENCSMPEVPIALYDYKEKKFLWAWHSKSVLGKKVMGEKYNSSVFKEHRVFQNRYEIIPMREIPEQDLLLIKDLLENGEEIDYSILGYNPNTYSNKTKFPILSENQVDYTKNNENNE